MSQGLKMGEYELNQSATWPTVSMSHRLSVTISEMWHNKRKVAR